LARTSGHSVFTDCLQHHALLDALLEAAVLAAVALRFGYLARAIGHARVHASVLHGALEEPLAPLARDNTVVQARGFVLADHAHQRLIVFLVRVIF
jgi:hypothetical protein